MKNSAGETPLDLADHQERYREAIERQSAEAIPRVKRWYDRVSCPTPSEGYLRPVHSGPSSIAYQLAREFKSRIAG
jgi:hypothetical protein